MCMDLYIINCSCTKDMVYLRFSSIVLAVSEYNFMIAERVFLIHVPVVLSDCF